MRTMPALQWSAIAWLWAMPTVLRAAVLRRRHGECATPLRTALGTALARRRRQAASLIRRTAVLWKGATILRGNAVMWWAAV